MGEPKTGSVTLIEKEERIRGTAGGNLHQKKMERGGKSTSFFKKNFSHAHARTTSRPETLRLDPRVLNQFKFEGMNCRDSPVASLLEKRDQVSKEGRLSHKDHSGDNPKASKTKKQKKEHDPNKPKQPNPSQAQTQTQTTNNQNPKHTQKENK